jgi:polar amino acid transport system substrate-binding protein
MRRWLRRSLFLALAVVLAGFLAVACGDDDEDEGGGEETPAAGVTAPELEDGTLQVLSDIAYAPIEFYEAGTNEATGLDVDLANALAEKLGVEVEFINTGFDGIIPALLAGDGDVIMSAMTITTEREAEIDFIPYINVGTGTLVAAGNPEGIAALEDLCGLTVAVQEGTIQQDMLDELNAGDCSDNQMEVVTFDQNPLAVEELRVGGADAVLADFPVALNDANESDGELEVVGDQFPTLMPYGIGLSKESTELRSALEDALQEIRDDGTYESILAEWGLESAALD